MKICIFFSFSFSDPLIFFLFSVNESPIKENQRWTSKLFTCSRANFGLSALYIEYSQVLKFLIREIIWENLPNHFIVVIKYERANLTQIFQLIQLIQAVKSSLWILKNKDVKKKSEEGCSTNLVILKILSRRSARRTLMPKDVPGRKKPHRTSKMLPTITYDMHKICNVYTKSSSLIKIIKDNVSAKSLTVTVRRKVGKDDANALM